MSGAGWSALYDFTYIQKIIDMEDQVVNDSSDENKTVSASGMSRLSLTPWIITRHTLLFVLTYFSVSFAYLQFAINLSDAFVFSAAFLFFLATHEFGHYLAAVRHGIRASLPWFIPLPIISIGTLGAVIQIKEPIQDTRSLFDIGISGPLYGFGVSLILICIGLFTLPEPAFVQKYPGHELLKRYVETHGQFPSAPLGDAPGQTLVLGNTLLFSIIAVFSSHLPPLFELYHYPILFAGWLGLFFTALNLMPFGQLDGGHILYALWGKRKQQGLSLIIYAFISGLAGVGAVYNLQLILQEFAFRFDALPWSIWATTLLFLFRYLTRFHWWKLVLYWLTSLSITLFIWNTLSAPEYAANYGTWLFWLFFIAFVIRLEHPPVLYEMALSRRQKFWGWLSILIFILCFSPLPFYFV